MAGRALQAQIELNSGTWTMREAPQMVETKPSVSSGRPVAVSHPTSGRAFHAHPDSRFFEASCSCAWSSSYCHSLPAEGRSALQPETLR